MAFPSTGLLDNFNRANEGPPPSSSWSGPAIGFLQANDLKVVSNACKATDADNATAYWNVSTFGPASEAYVTITTKGGNTDVTSLYIRLTNPNTAGSEDGYVALLTVASGTDTQRISRVDNGALTQLGASNSLEISNGNKLGIEASGSTLTLYRHDGASWASLFNRSDATYSAAGYIGLGQVGTTAVLDDFGGGTIVTAVVVTPTTAALTLTTFAPTVTVSNNQTATPTTAVLALTTFAPTVLTPQTITPPTAALTLTTFAPTANVGVRAIPETASLALTTFAPTIINPVSATPNVASLVLATFAPTILLPQLVTPAALALALTTFAPTILLPQLVTPPTASLVLTTFAPTVSVLESPGIVVSKFFLLEIDGTDRTDYLQQSTFSFESVVEEIALADFTIKKEPTGWAPSDLKPLEIWQPVESIEDGSISAGGTTFHTPSIMWNSTYIGKNIRIATAGGGGKAHYSVIEEILGTPGDVRIKHPAISSATVAASLVGTARYRGRISRVGKARVSDAIEAEDAPEDSGPTRTFDYKVQCMDLAGSLSTVFPMTERPIEFLYDRVVALLALPEVSPTGVRADWLATDDPGPLMSATSYNGKVDAWTVFKNLFGSVAAVSETLGWERVEIFNASQPWTCPAGVTSVQVENWGAGAGGAEGTVEVQSAPGGGAGAYSRKTITTTPSTVYQLNIGKGGLGGRDGVAPTAGGDTIFGSNLVVAKGGSAPIGIAGGIGGLASAGTGDTKYNGGNGGIGEGLAGGGGGAGGPNSGHGTDADADDVNWSGGEGDEFDGGDGGSGSSGEFGDAAGGHMPGGGGAGGHYYAGIHAGGPGGVGQIRLTYVGTVDANGNGIWVGPPTSRAKVETWGAGAGGAGSSITDGPGGGGGSYARRETVLVEEGEDYAYHVGKGGIGGPLDEAGDDGEATWFDDGTSSGDITITRTYDNPGDYPWLCIAGITSIVVKAWAAGGGGSSSGAGGFPGGGGAFAQATLTLTVGQVYMIHVPGKSASATSDGGDATFGSTLVKAAGGKAGVNGGTGGAVADCIGDIKYRGGNGIAGGGGGGGGGGAGTTGAGGDASGNTGGTGTALDGGAGGSNTGGGPSPNHGKNFGGAGSATFTQGSTRGAQGKVELTYTIARPQVLAFGGKGGESAGDVTQGSTNAGISVKGYGGDSPNDPSYTTPKNSGDVVYYGGDGAIECVAGGGAGSNEPGGHADGVFQLSGEGGEEDGGQGGNAPADFDPGIDGVKFGGAGSGGNVDIGGDGAVGEIKITYTPNAPYFIYINEIGRLVIEVPGTSSMPEDLTDSHALLETPPTSAFESGNYANRVRRFYGEGLTKYVEENDEDEQDALGGLVVTRVIEDESILAVSTAQVLAQRDLAILADLERYLLDGIETEVDGYKAGQFGPASFSLYDVSGEHLIQTVRGLFLGLPDRPWLWSITATNGERRMETEIDYRRRLIEGG